MRVIIGSHEEKTGRKNPDSTPVMQTVVDAVNIPDDPQYLSDFPKQAISAVGAPREDGTVCVVTVDGKKFYVKPGRVGVAHGKEDPKPPKE